MSQVPGLTHGSAGCQAADERAQPPLAQERSVTTIIRSSATPKLNIGSLKWGAARRTHMSCDLAGASVGRLAWSLTSLSVSPRAGTGTAESLRESTERVAGPSLWRFQSSRPLSPAHASDLSWVISSLAACPRGRVPWVTWKGTELSHITGRSCPSYAKGPQRERGAEKGGEAEKAARPAPPLVLGFVVKVPARHGSQAE